MQTVQDSPKTKAIKENISSLEAQLKDAKQTLYESQQDEHDLHVGDIVTSRYGTFKIAHINFYDFGPSAEGYKQKKDGGWSERSIYIGTDFTKVQ